MSDVYDYNNEWNILTGKDIVMQATQDIAGNTNMFGDISLVFADKITKKHIDEMEGSEFSNGQSGLSNLNTNDMETGSVSNTTRGESNNKSNEKTRDEVLVTRLQISEALSTVYGVDLMQDNVDLCRERLLCGREDLRHIVEQNIVCADGLRYHYRFDGSYPYDDEVKAQEFNQRFNNLFEGSNNE